MREITIFISVLNWNKAKETLICVENLLNIDKYPNLDVQLFVIDNGSHESDWSHLSAGLQNKSVTIIRLKQNTGFSGGHNIIMQKAIDEKADYVWLVNNDGIAPPNTLNEIVDVAENDYTCGAVSPLIVVMGNESTVGFGDAYHDWKSLNTIRFKEVNAESKKIHVDEKSLWLSGAAILFRVKALKEVGLLDDNFFAYYEDNDICAKLAFAGWKNKVAFNARFVHEDPTERKPYFYYLMARNGIFFWLRHTPKKYRRFIKLRLFERAIFMANTLLFDMNSQELSDACLLGCLDGFLGRGGKPDLDRKVPLFLKLLKKIRAYSHLKYLKEKNRSRFVKGLNDEK